jgi:hypothetical protein
LLSVEIVYSHEINSSLVFHWLHTSDEIIYFFFSTQPRSFLLNSNFLYLLSFTNSFTHSFDATLYLEFKCSESISTRTVEFRFLINLSSRGMLCTPSTMLAIGHQLSASVSVPMLCFVFFNLKYFPSLPEVNSYQLSIQVQALYISL